MPEDRDEAELQEKMEAAGDEPVKKPSTVPDGSQDEFHKFTGVPTQWSSTSGYSFSATGTTVDKLPPGYYHILTSQDKGLYFSRQYTRTDNLLRFPDTNSDKILEEIKLFWTKGDRFAEHRLPHKRGILLWGPPGSGKTCCISLLVDDVIARGGIALRFDHPPLFESGLRVLRLIQPQTPVVAIMEDIDDMIQRLGETEILNILDGITSNEKIVYLASTNYPERLGPRIINRPSRFDKRFKIGLPGRASRTMYLESLGLKPVPEKWLDDTEDFSLAHLKELFVAVKILDNSYDEALRTLRNMQDRVKATDGKALGFSTGTSLPS